MKAIHLSGQRSGCFAAAVVSILWGLSYIGATRALNGGFDTFSLVFVRFAVSATVLLVLALLRQESLQMRLRDVPALIFSSVTGITLYYFCELNGLKNLSASIASLIIATIPLMSLLVGIVFRGLKPKKSTWLGLALSLIGVYLVVFSEVGDNSVKGFLFMLGSCLCWIFYLEAADHLLNRYSCLCVTFWQSIAALVTLIPFVLAENVPWHAITTEAWLWACLFLGVICSALCYILNNFSIAVLSPQKNAFFLNLSPVATAVGGYLVLGERISLLQAIGGILILASLFLISTKSSK